jgi:hypothetical protein
VHPRATYQPCHQNGHRANLFSSTTSGNAPNASACASRFSANEADGSSVPARGGGVVVSGRVYDVQHGRVFWKGRSGGMQEEEWRHADGGKEGGRVNCRRSVSDGWCRVRVRDRDRCKERRTNSQDIVGACVVGVRGYVLFDDPASRPHHSSRDIVGACRIFLGATDGSSPGLCKPTFSRVRR